MNADQDEDCCNDPTCPYSEGHVDSPVIDFTSPEVQIMELRTDIVVLQLQMAAMMREIVALKRLKI